MPPALASCLTILFIFWLFYRNAKSGLRTSAALWLPTIWLITHASRPLACWLAGGADTDQTGSIADGSPIDRSVLLILIISAIVVLVRRGVNWGEAIRSNRWLSVFFLYLLVSVIWADSPFVAFKRWFREFGNLPMILLIITEEDPIEAVRQVFVRCAYVLIPVSVLLVKYYLNLGRYYDIWTGHPFLCGVATDKNALGRLAMVSGLFILWNLIVNMQSKWSDRTRWQKWKAALPDLSVFVLCLWILHGADSQTSRGCFAAGLVVLFATRIGWLYNNPRRLAWCGSILIILSFLFFYFPGLRQIITTSMGRQVNLTDRTDVWAAVMSAGTDPIIGTGFASFWLTSEGLSIANNLGVTEAHNGFLETYLNSGIIGVILLLAVLLVAGRNVVKQFVARNPNASLFASLFIACLVYNYTEADFNTGGIVGFALWLVALQPEPNGDVTVTDQTNNFDEPDPKGHTVIFGNS
jgi:exopolysaccharide production protein ExoQ